MIEGDKHKERARLFGGGGGGTTQSIKVFDSFFLEFPAIERDRGREVSKQPSDTIEWNLPNSEEA